MSAQRKDWHKSMETATFKAGSAFGMSIISAGFSFALLIIVWIGFWVVTGFFGPSDPELELRTPQILTTVWWLWPYFVVIGAAIPWITALRDFRRDTASVAEQEQRLVAENVSARAAAVQHATEVALHENGLAAAAWIKLPDDLENALSWNEEGKKHFTAGAYSPFWESIERGYDCLGAYALRLEEIRRYADQHAIHQQNHETNGGSFDLPPFPIRVQDIVPSEAALAVTQALHREVYEAQKDPVYAQIWEQRRNTAAVIQGFATLSEAVNQMSLRVSTEIRSLGQALEFSLREISGDIRAGNAQLTEISSAQQQLVEHAAHLNTQVNAASVRLTSIERRVPRPRTFLTG